MFGVPQNWGKLGERTVVFVTWDGPQTNYLESLFLPVFVELSARGFEFKILQLSWAKSERVSILRKRCQDHHISYVRLPVLRWPRGFGQALSVFMGALWLRRELREAGRSVVLFRSIMGALVVRFSGVSSTHDLIYDSDGLPIQERQDFSRLRKGSPIHGILCSVENWALTRSRAVFARSEFGKQFLADRVAELKSTTPVHVISNGRVRQDQDFLPSPRETDLDRSRPLSICYVGSWGEPYDPERILKLARYLRESFDGAEFHIFTRDFSKVASDRAKAGLAEADWISVRWSEAEHLQKDLLGFDIGLALRKTTVSTRATSPMKLGFYLASGIALVGDQIGDEVPSLVAKNAMFALEKFPTPELTAWISEFALSDRATRFERCQKLAIEKFSIMKSLDQYEAALRL